MLRGKGEERCTWYMAGNLAGLDRREDAELAVEVMEVLQKGNVRAKGNKTYHLVISFHPEDRRLAPAELEDVVHRAVRAAGLAEHQYVAVRHSEQEHEHVHVAVNKIHPETLKIHHPYKAIPAFQALASILEQELGLHRVDRSTGHSQSHRARDFEAHRSIESFSRWARRNIGETRALDGIASWAALHEELKGFGVRLVPRGNGLAIVDATRANLGCKASALGRGWSKERLRERYGEFVPGPHAAEVAREQVQPYEERPLGRALDDGLWREYREALDAARRNHRELREAMASRVQAAREAHAERFKLRHHAIAAMPIPPLEKRCLYKTLSFERKCAERRLRATIKRWRAVTVDTHPGSWKQFLADRAVRGDQRALRRLRQQFRGPAIKSRHSRLRSLSSRDRRASRGTLVHNLGGGARLRESAGLIELLGDPSEVALEQLVRVAKQRFGPKGITLLGPRKVRERLTRIVVEHGLELAHERER
ncbi:MAG: relaxase/mobilization nuclease domain-containing protein [Deltaproteobacteria bacterium]|nr:relaxase/mobilization nuclease domain-containing protein [Deltaproteobacteria bacterium]